MNKAELIAAIADKQGTTKVQAQENLEAVVSVIYDQLVAGNNVRLIGFGSFKVATTSARRGRNPHTGVIMKIAAAKKVRFSAGSALKTAINIKPKSTAKKTK